MIILCVDWLNYSLFCSYSICIDFKRRMKLNDLVKLILYFLYGILSFDKKRYGIISYNFLFFYIFN